MNPERAQMLREIRQEFCRKCIELSPGTKMCDDHICREFNHYLEDLFASAESQTEPENKNEC